MGGFIPLWCCLLLCLISQVFFLFFFSFLLLLLLLLLTPLSPAFKNLIANGLVLAADGKKMSKRLKNYPDPNGVIDKYGSDALRLYLINSPVVHADDLRFVGKRGEESGVPFYWFF